MGAIVYYLYGSKRETEKTLVATFGSEQQLLAYVGWATLRQEADHTFKFEQGSVLSGFQSYTYSTAPLTNCDPNGVAHNPSPSML
jgi:hypothetical protein